MFASTKCRVLFIMLAVGFVSIIAKWVLSAAQSGPTINKYTPYMLDDKEGAPSWDDAIVFGT